MKQWSITRSQLISALMFPVSVFFHFRPPYLILCVNPRSKCRPFSDTTVATGRVSGCKACHTADSPRIPQ